MTLDDGTYTAVIDRFEDDQAVLLVEADDQTQIGELVVAQATIPEAGRHVDAVLTIELQNEVVTACQYDQAETEERTDRVQNRFSRLSERLSSPDDDEPE